MLLTIFSLVVVLGVLIAVHEFGHFIVAKAVGIQVLRFSLGFGRPVISWRRGETEYWISWIPLGGYVKMAGLEDEGMAGELEGGKAAARQARQDGSAPARREARRAPGDSPPRGHDPATSAGRRGVSALPGAHRAGRAGQTGLPRRVERRRRHPEGEWRHDLFVGRDVPQDSAKPGPRAGAHRAAGRQRPELESGPRDQRLRWSKVWHHLGVCESTDGSRSGRHRDGAGDGRSADGATGRWSRRQRQAPRDRPDFGS